MLQKNPFGVETVDVKGEKVPPIPVRLLRQVNSGAHDARGKPIVMKADTEHLLDANFALQLIACNRAVRIEKMAPAEQDPELAGAGAKGGGSAGKGDKGAEK
jgi:hypothetical protein